MVLSRQLEFMYSQIILILTGKVHDVLKNNSSKDIRDLLGPETNQILQQACAPNLVPEFIAFQSLKTMSIPKELRQMLQYHLRSCVEDSGSA